MADFEMTAFIERAKSGEPAHAGDIAAFVAAYMAGEVSDAQAAAWMMAVCLRGLTDQATVALTSAMVASGPSLDLSDLPHTADKHSTGGVGDKVSLVACPLASAAGVTVAKMSGRGLGHTGGTVDKLESIPGFRTALSMKAFRAQAASVGLVIASQTEDMAPADKRLYALRNHTATVDSMPLIAASVMSKKLAAGAGAIVLDVKCGEGAFVRTPEQAAHLARLMCFIGRAEGRAMAAVVSPMDQPLGSAVGNALEVREAIEALKGQGPSDLTELSLQIAARMVELAEVKETPEEARAAVEAALQSGEGAAKLRAMIKAQGGDARVVDDPSRLPKAPCIDYVRSPATGRVTAADPRRIAAAVAALGGSGGKRGGPDPGVGVKLLRKQGEAVDPGDAIAEIHAPSRDALEQAHRLLAGAIRIGGLESPGPRPLEVNWVE